MSPTLAIGITLLASASQVPTDQPGGKPSGLPTSGFPKASGPHAASPAPKSPSTDAAEALVKQFDRNGDRMLNADEFPRLFRASFGRVDSNRNGYLSLIELKRTFEKGLARQIHRGEVIADTISIVADDFVVDIYHNGEKVPDSRRTLVEENHGATTEKVEIEVREGDWVVFNVVNDRLRWDGCSYFAAAGMKTDRGVGFVTETKSGRWTACDEPAEVAAFLAYPEGVAKPARKIERKWSEGDPKMNRLTDGWKGEAVWGDSRNTWIKYVAPLPRDDAKP